MVDRNDRCANIDSNIRNLSSEWHQLGNELLGMERNAQDLGSQLREAEDRLADLQIGSLPGRLARPGPAGAALTVVDAVRTANEMARLNAGIRRLLDHLRRLEHRRDDVARRRDNKLGLIRQSQNAFGTNNCFALGFGHEVLNMP